MTLAHAAFIEARRVAVLEVKAQLRSRGIKITLLPMKVIRAQADQYLLAHRHELLAQARERVERWALPR